MDTSPDRPASPPTQTIVIQQRERGGWVRRVLVTLFWMFLLFAFLSTYLVRDQGFPTRLPERYVAGEWGASKVAIIEIGELIFDPEIEHILKQVRQARADDTVKAVVLRIDSPGGTVSGADQVWREVELLKKTGKPVVASLGGLAASGGYYVAAAADPILAEPTTLTGSIGVITELPNVSGLLDKVGVKMETIATGPWKDSGSYFRPLTDVERDRWRQMIDAAYQRFVRIVASGRNLPVPTVRALADGKIYTADEALQNKLVSEIGYLDDAILIAQRLAKLETSRVVKYAKPLSLSDALLSITAPRPSWSLAPDAALRLHTPRVLYLAR
jgi:protease-4